MHVVQVTIDSLAPRELAAWWARALGGEVKQDGHFCWVDTAQGPPLGFQHVDEPTPGKNKVHLDLSVRDLHQAIDALAAMGARVMRRQEAPGVDWAVLADPEENEFCVTTLGSQDTAH
jgi:predicted enzyme related to lactoylglutathione lyase